MIWVNWCIWSIVFFYGDCLAQQRTPSAIWYFPGISYRISPNIGISGHYGINNRQQINAIYLQSFIKINKHFTLNPAYLYLMMNSQGVGQKIHTFMPAMHIHLPLGRFLLEDRNMLWNWVRKDAADLYFYRNRLRLNWLFKHEKNQNSVYLFDEISYSFNDLQWSRNRLGVGLNYQIIPSINMDTFYARQYDAVTNNTFFFFMMATFQF